jgi:hypothetical protein
MKVHQERSPFQIAPKCPTTYAIHAYLGKRVHRKFEFVGIDICIKLPQALAFSLARLGIGMGQGLPRALKTMCGYFPAFDQTQIGHVKPA